MLGQWGNFAGTEPSARYNSGSLPLSNFFRIAAAMEAKGRIGSDMLHRVSISPQERLIAYQTVEARRLQWDNLLWQVPVLSFTAQAFLFSIALAPDARSAARIIVALLSIVITILSITLMARHRQAEVTDAHWLEEYEEDWPDKDKQHGDAWRLRRNAEKPHGGVLDSIVPLFPGYITWQIGLSFFGLAAIAVIAIAIFAPGLLSASQR